MISSQILDGWGTGRKVRVYGEGEIGVAVHQHPPREESIIGIPFAEYFSNGGSSDMAVDGSSTPVEFGVTASPDYDTYLKFVSVNIGDNGSPTLNKFGAITALSNGVAWCWDTTDLGSVILESGLKTNLEFIRAAPQTAGIGDGTTAFLADVSGGGTEKNYLPQIDLSTLYGGEWGLRLRKGTNDRMFFKVRDNLSSLLTFDIKVTGRRI